MFFYEKVLLYAYPHIEAIADSIDNSVLKKALSSFSDYTSAEAQAEYIIELTEQKKRLIELKCVLDEIIGRFSEEELMYFEYKYFKTKNKSYFQNFDFTSRKYFRTQVRLAKKFREALENKGFNEKWYYENFGNIDFIKQLASRVAELEKSSYKNKKKSECKVVLKHCKVERQKQAV